MPNKRISLAVTLLAVLLLGAPAAVPPAFACPNVQPDYVIVRYYNFNPCAAEPCGPSLYLVGEEHFYCDGSYYSWGNTNTRFTDTIVRPCEFCGPEEP